MSTEENKLYDPELKELMRLVFDKAKRDSRETSKTGLSKHIETEMNSRINQRTLVRYYNQFILDEGGEVAHNRAGFDIVSNYLGYGNFADFCRQVFPEEDSTGDKEAEDKKIKVHSRSASATNFRKKAAGIGIVTALGLGTYFGMNTLNQPQCMRWAGTSYVKAHCDETLHPNTPVIPLNEQLLEYLHKIEVADTTTFFEAGKPMVWYLKVDGEIEFYSAPGNHPVSGKALKPVTSYIVEKYVLKTSRPAED